MDSYLMTPKLFRSLAACVSGFTNMNGNTYMEHICIIFDKKLTDNQKTIIKDKKNELEALDYLGTIMNYTHTI